MGKVEGITMTDTPERGILSSPNQNYILKCLRFLQERYPPSPNNHELALALTHRLSNQNLINLVDKNLFNVQ